MTYSKIDPDSLDSASSVLDLLKPPETITSVLESDDRDVNPIGDANAPQLDFEFRTSSFKYLNPTETRLLVQGKVTKADGSDIEDADTCTVTPSCNLLHTLFQSYVLSIAGHDVAYGSNYPWQAYLLEVVSRSTGHKRSIGASSGWIEDSAGRIDRASIAASPREGHEGEKGTHRQQQRVSTLRRFQHPLPEPEPLPPTRHARQTSSHPIQRQAVSPLHRGRRHRTTTKSYSPRSRS